MHFSFLKHAFYFIFKRFRLLSVLLLLCFCQSSAVFGAASVSVAADIKDESYFIGLTEAADAKVVHVGLAIVATGRYIEFVDSLIESAEKYFCKDHHVTYFVFTDQHYAPRNNTVIIPQNRMGWPFDTMKRYHVYYAHKEFFEGQDYIFAIDADMLFVNDVGSEILSDHTAVLHPGYVGSKGTYETNMQSKAGIGPHEGRYYFCGGVYGGSFDRFFHICKTNMDNIDDDLSRGIIAIWHDESHWNRYCIDHEPSLILSPAYCCIDLDVGHVDYIPRILALTKNHAAYRD